MPTPENHSLSLILRWTLALFLVVALDQAPGALAGQRIGGWVRPEFSELQPNIREGGRANSIAVDPANNDVILVTSETGGLFRSTNRGLNWRHVDGLPEFATNAVAFVPGTPRVVIVTTKEDWKTANGGGIWRSTDHGLTWKHVPGPPAPPGVPDRVNGWEVSLSAWEISIAPDTGHIYVGTSYGCSWSKDSGTTWTHVDVFGGGDRRVLSVVAQRNGLVLAAGPAGLRRSTDHGATWSPPATSVGGIVDMHAFGRSPFLADQAYLVNRDTELSYTEDGGQNWTRISSTPTGGGCGGIAFVKAIGRTERASGGRVHRRRRTIDLYFGNRCGLSRLSSPSISGTNRFNYGGTWVTLNMDHGDTRDLAFNSTGRPLLLGTDGGLHNTTDGGLNWTFVGGGNAGYNALQITEVQGQWIEDISRHDLYFGTQDNHLHSSGDGGTTWSVGMCCEGFFIDGMRRVPTMADSKITNVACAGCSNLVSGALFASVATWPNPSGLVAGNPKIVGQSFHVQGVNDGAPWTKGLASTTTLGSTWQQYATFPEDRRDLPKLTHPWLEPVLYQSIRAGWDAVRNFEINRLARIVKRPIGTGASVSYPAMNNFGGLGINPTMFAWYQVFGVDPRNTGHVIAPDVVNERMMETWDGGENWTEIPQLTSLVTDGGRFLFRRWIFPHATSVSFCPDDPNFIAVGTSQGGIIASGDRGATWDKVPGTMLATYITSFHWRTCRDVIVSTYGRGLWRLRWSIFIPRTDFERYCTRPCIIVPVIDPAERFDLAVLVFDGRIMGARAVNGRLRELFVSPGSFLAFVTNSQSLLEVKVMETTKSIGFQGVMRAPQPPESGSIVAGLTLGKAGRLRGVVFAGTALSMQQPDERDKPREEPVGRENSPAAGKPYLQILTDASNTVMSGEPITLAGRDFKPGEPIEIALDGRAVGRVTANADGTFSLKVSPPAEPGPHTITVRQGEVTDGAMFLVRHEDRPKERDRKR